MAEVSSSASLQQPEVPSSEKAQAPRSTGLTLILPPLRGGKPIKIKHRNQSDLQPPLALPEPETKKIARPAKLKPLKDVLARLISQIKKKDDYAFFLSPVNASTVPGYSDAVKHPMDFGTMSAKVERGRYRSLEEFTSDFRLVTENAKIFNPPGTIYHSEADRIEIWGLDHIAKAAPTVIEYETDWNIEIEQDDLDILPPVEEEDSSAHAGTPMDGRDARTGRSPSVSSVQQQLGSSRRGPRGPYKRTVPSNSITESIDAEGRLPGSKDGLGAFPAGSDWAEMMLFLKLKGKRYKTKKERLRIEKGGPPYCADGSLDYTEMEDPFSVLSVLVPEPPSRPNLSPLYPSTIVKPSTGDSRSSLAPVSLLPSNASVNLPFPLARPPIEMSSLANTASSTSPKKRRHWNITNNAITRGKGKDAGEDDILPVPAGPTTFPPKATDWGSFAVLMSALDEESRKRRAAGEDLEETVVADMIRDSADRPLKRSRTEGSAEGTGLSVPYDPIEGYWTASRTAEAEEYLKDIVYGGVDGIAYVRSLAQFVDIPPPMSQSPSDLGLGTSLAHYVEQTIIDPLTDGRHALLREAAVILSSSEQEAGSTISPLGSIPVARQVALSHHVYPAAARALASLLQIRTHQIDMGALIYAPSELFDSDQEWAGADYKRQKGGESSMQYDGIFTASENGAEPILPVGDAISGEPDALSDVTETKLADSMAYEGPELFGHVLQYTAEAIAELNRRLAAGAVISRGDLEIGAADTPRMLAEDSTAYASSPLSQHNEFQERLLPDASLAPPLSSVLSEDTGLRNLRLNLLALAKRAPLDKIARLPADLVPEHIRHYIPTLGL